MKITRKQFLVSGLAAAGAAAGIGASACGGDDGGPASGGGCKSSDAGVDIAGNHGHALTVTSAEVTSGTALVKDIQGSAPHTHEFTLSTNDLQTLKGGGSITKQSTNAAGHDHLITVSC